MPEVRSDNEYRGIRLVLAALTLFTTLAITVATILILRPLEKLDERTTNNGARIAKLHGIPQALRDLRTQVHDDNKGLNAEVHKVAKEMGSLTTLPERLRDVENRLTSAAGKLDKAVGQLDGLGNLATLVGELQTSVNSLSSKKISIVRDCGRGVLHNSSDAGVPKGMQFLLGKKRNLALSPQIRQDDGVATKFF